MTAKQLKTLTVSGLAAWRGWLARHHAAESEIWLVFHKVHTGRPTISYSDALDEALVRFVRHGQQSRDGHPAFPEFVTPSS